MVARPRPGRSTTPPTNSGARFSMRWMLLYPTLTWSRLTSASRFSMRRSTFFCRYRQRSSTSWSRFSISEMPLPSSQRHFRPVYSSRFSMRGKPGGAGRGTEPLHPLATGKTRRRDGNGNNRTLVLQVQHVVQRRRAVLLELAAQFEQKLLGQPTRGRSSAKRTPRRDGGMAGGQANRGPADSSCSSACPVGAGDGSTAVSAPSAMVAEKMPGRRGLFFCNGYRTSP